MLARSQFIFQNGKKVNPINKCNKKEEIQFEIDEKGGEDFGNDKIIKFVL